MWQIPDTSVVRFAKLMANCCHRIGKTLPSHWQSLANTVAITVRYLS
ncbi:hypothetical protein [uncultured Bacteroides sp.]|nr:hypothetical protein [uncultured Bacteroides sp.]